MALRSKASLLLILLLAGAAAAANHAPALAPIEGKNVYLGETLSFNLIAKDLDGDSLFFSGANLPARSTLDPETGQFSWTPNINQLGLHYPTFIVSDDGDPALSTSVIVPVRVLFRTVRQEKDWGFGVKAQSTVFETSDPTDLYPKVDRIEIDGQPAAALDNLEVSADPTLKIELASLYDIDRANLSVLIDGADVGPLSYSDVQTFGAQQNTLSLTLTLSPRGLAAGQHTVSIRSGNSLGYSTQVINLTAGAVRVTDNPLTFPSPFTPGSSNVVIQYTLSQNADIELVIVGSTGEIAKKTLLFKGNEGGRTGLNKVPWDGRTDRGLFAANGIYVAAITDKGNNKILGKAKLTVYK